VTAAQDRLHFAAFDVVAGNRAELVEMLREWSARTPQGDGVRGVADGSGRGVSRDSRRSRRPRTTVATIEPSTTTTGTAYRIQSAQWPTCAITDI
jgi:hypothetical protein